MYYDASMETIDSEVPKHPYTVAETFDSEVPEHHYSIPKIRLIPGYNVSEHCIFRVPTHIRKVNEKAYTPQAFSIGPFHYGTKELETMERLKKIYECYFFKERTTLEKREELLAFIKDHEKEIRDCYSERCELESKKYVEMILRDAIFIIDVFLRIYRQQNQHVDDPDRLHEIKPTEKLALMLDFVLLENQLPYFLLEELYKLVARGPRFIDLCCEFFFGPDKVFDSVPEIKHFTDLLRVDLVKGYPQQNLEKKSYEVNIDVDLPSAAKLRESGVKFSAGDHVQSLFDIKFEEGELSIPQFSVDNATETKFRNIMALEQCYYPNTTLVCDYVELLDSLIDEKRDLDLLVEKGIISNGMGDRMAILRLFNTLCTQITMNRVHYKVISETLKKHYNDPCNHIWAKLKSLYFSDIWRGTATVAAAVLLILTFLQTVSSFLQLK